MAEDGTLTLRVAIDGPAASGKSAVGSAVAARLDVPFIDTGGMYRALTWLALQRGIAPHDADALSRLAAAITMQVDPAPAGSSAYCHVIVDGQDATPHLRDAAVEQSVSLVSAVPEVRRRLVGLQRHLAGGSVVMAGRDIGSVVLPDAVVKVFLDASAEERARRRQRELLADGKAADFEQLLRGMRRRDRLDSTRTVSPLQPAADAVRLSTDGLDLEQVIGRVMQLIQGHQPCASGT